MRTAAMVRADWQRTVQSPSLVRCLRALFVRVGGGAVKLVSLTRQSFPHVTPLAARFRIVASASAAGSSVRLVSDLIALGKGRTEVTLTVTGPEAASAQLQAAELRLARLLAGRMTA